MEYVVDVYQEYEKTVTKTDQLTRIDCNDEFLQEALYNMVRGDRRRNSEYPSLCSYITVKQYPSVDVLHAKPELLKVLVGDNVAYTIMRAREQNSSREEIHTLIDMWVRPEIMKLFGDIL